MLGLVRAVLFLGKAKFAVSLHLRPEEYNIGNPNYRVKEQRQREPRLGPAWMPRLVLLDFFFRPGMEPVGIVVCQLWHAKRRVVDRKADFDGPLEHLAQHVNALVRGFGGCRLGVAYMKANVARLHARERLGAMFPADAL